MTHSMKLKRGQIQAQMDIANTRIMEWNAHLQSRMLRDVNVFPIGLAHTHADHWVQFKAKLVRDLIRMSLPTP